MLSGAKHLPEDSNGKRRFEFANTEGEAAFRLLKSCVEPEGLHKAPGVGGASRGR